MHDTITAVPFTFNKDYYDREQVRPYWDDYMLRFRELEAAGRYAYNADFKGRIASLEGTDDKNEDTAIYLLQGLRHLEELAATIAAFGGEPVTVDDLAGGRVIRGTVAEYGYYMGGTGWRVWESARLVAVQGPDGIDRGMAVLPKGKRTHGYALSGKVLVRS